MTVKGRPKDDPSDPKCGMVIDFGDLKRIVAEQIVGRYDHALVMRRTESNAGLVEALCSRYSKLEVTDYQPTCENMVADFAARIAARLPEGVTLHSVRLHETATSFAEWFADDNP